MKRTIMTNTDTFEQPNTGANEESLRMVSAAPVGNEPVSDEELRPHILEDSSDSQGSKRSCSFSSMLLENVTFLGPYPACGASGTWQNHFGHDCGQ